MEEQVYVCKSTYLKLLERDDFLECLEGVGVDNWVGWDDACEMHEQYKAPNV